MQVFDAVAASVVIFLGVLLLAPFEMRSDPYGYLECTVVGLRCPQRFEAVLSSARLNAPIGGVIELVGSPSKLTTDGSSVRAIFADRDASIATRTDQIGSIKEVYAVLGQSSKWNISNSWSGEVGARVYLPDLRRLLDGLTYRLRHKTIPDDDIAFDRDEILKNRAALGRVTIGEAMGDLRDFISRGNCELVYNFGMGVCVIENGVTCRAKGVEISLGYHDCAPNYIYQRKTKFNFTTLKEILKNKGVEFTLEGGFWDEKWRTRKGRLLQAELYDSLYKHVIVTRLEYGIE